MTSLARLTAKNRFEDSKLCAWDPPFHVIWDVDYGTRLNHVLAMSKPKLTPEEYLKGQHHRLMMSALDFRHALSAATFLMEDVDWEFKRCTQEERRRFKCYETSMVVSYGRPFSTARGMASSFNWKLMGREFTMSVEEKILHEMLGFVDKGYPLQD